MAFKSYRCLSSVAEPSQSYKSHYDVYPSVFATAAWNNYRMMRITIHDFIITSTLANEPNKHLDNLRHSVKILFDMAEGICCSVPNIPYTHAYRHAQNGAHLSRQADIANAALNIGEGYLLVWPLFIVATLRTTEDDQRCWIANALNDIASRLGMPSAKSMAAILKTTVASNLESRE